MNLVIIPIKNSDISISIDHNCSNRFYILRQLRKFQLNHLRSGFEKFTEANKEPYFPQPLPEMCEHIIHGLFEKFVKICLNDDWRINKVHEPRVASLSV